MAGRRCTICHDERRKAIDATILSGESERVIAHLYGLERTAVQRHKSRHIAPMVRKVVATKERKAEGNVRTWLEQIDDAKQAALENLEWAKREGDPPDANGAVGQVLKSLELIGKASGELAKAEAKAWWEEFGYRSKLEVARALEAHRASFDIADPDLFENWIETGMLLIRAQPQRRVEVLQSLSGGLVEASNGVGALVSDNGVGGNGHDPVAHGSEPKRKALAPVRGKTAGGGNGAG